MCESYEAQLQRVQEQMLEELDGKEQELSRLREECSKARAGILRERKAKDELRCKMEEAREQFKAQVCVIILCCYLYTVQLDYACIVGRTFPNKYATATDKA